MTPTVVVAGHLMLDVVVKPHGPVEWVSDTPSSVHLARGGAGATIAQAVVRGGVGATYLAAVGHDITAQVVLDACRTPVVVERVDAPTGALVALVGPDGQRAMLTHTGANALLSADFLETQLRALQPTWFHLSGYVLLTPETFEAGCRALAVAREIGAGVSSDACSVGPLQATGLRRFGEALAGIDMFFCNEQEAALFGDHLFLIAPEVIVTQGAAGATVFFGGTDLATRRPSQATTVVDTTGAGDTATGAYLAGRLQGLQPSSALEAAMGAAATVIAHLGAD
jgi:sugar/nucleoside kinase (ribokinase family)